MTDQTGAPAGGEAIDLPSDAPETFNSVNEAAAYFTQLQEKRKNPPAESADAATAEQELSGEDNPESPQGETTAEDQETEPAKPAIEPPKSWTKDLHDHWANLDPVLQERIVARDREDQAAIKRAFNEAADERKAVKAEREAAEQARKQYEAQLPNLMQTLQDAQQASFGDIKTVADVERLQAEDPFRFQAWQVQQMKLQAAHAENERVKSEQTQKQQTDWNQHVQRENELAAELIPELADKDKNAAFYKRAVDRLAELGFKQDEVRDLATGKEKLSLHDHRLQVLLASDFKLADIQKAPKAVVKPNLPPVQKPGTARAPGSASSEREQNLTRKAELSVAEATELYTLQQRRRAS